MSNIMDSDKIMADAAMTPDTVQTTHTLADEHANIKTLDTASEHQELVEPHSEKASTKGELSSAPQYSKIPQSTKHVLDNKHASKRYGCYFEGQLERGRFLLSLSEIKGKDDIEAMPKVSREQREMDIEMRVAMPIHKYDDDDGEITPRASRYMDTEEWDPEAHALLTAKSRTSEYFDTAEHFSQNPENADIQTGESREMGGGNQFNGHEHESSLILPMYRGDNGVVSGQTSFDEHAMQANECEYGGVGVEGEASGSNVSHTASCKSNKLSHLCSVTETLVTYPHSRRISYYSRCQ